MHSYGRANVRRGAYTWSNRSVKERVGLSSGEPIRRGLVGREMLCFVKFRHFAFLTFHKIQSAENMYIPEYSSWYWSCIGLFYLISIRLVCGFHTVVLFF